MSVMDVINELVAVGFLEADPDFLLGGGLYIPMYQLVCLLVFIFSVWFIARFVRFVWLRFTGRK